MSYRITRPRFRRLTVGLTVAAATTLLGAGTADAGSGASAGVTANGTLSISGAVLRDNLTVSPALDKIILLSGDPNRTVQAGSGCVQLNSFKLQCTGVTSVVFNGGSGDDRFNNASSLPSTMNGGTGDDILIGGSGFDSAQGAKGADKCTAESERSCEL